MARQYMHDNQHLNRPMYCEGCDWIGRSGELIAKDVLRCPKCNGDQVRYFVIEAPKGMQ